MVKEWRTVLIGDCLEFKNGLNKGKEFFGSGTPIVNYVDVYKNSGITSDMIKGKVSLSTDEIKRYEVRKGDVFFTRTSETPREVGLAAVMLEHVDDCVFSGFVLRGRPKNNLLDIKYCKYCFSVFEVRKNIVSSCTYTTRALTNGKHLSAIEIPLPNKKEQQAIATALSDVDSLVGSITKLINKKKNIKQGVMQELLTGNKRLEGFSDEWTKKTVSEFGVIITGTTPSTINTKYWGGEIPWITPTDIDDKKNIFSSERKLTELGFNKVRKLDANTVLITCIASIGKNAVLRKTGSCNQQINAIIPNKDINHDFLYYLFELNKQYLLSKAGITATSIISKSEFCLMEFVVPITNEEQTAIANILSDMDAEIEALEHKLSKYKAIKQGMMQELLTGRIRLI